MTIDTRTELTFFQPLNHVLKDDVSATGSKGRRYLAEIAGLKFCDSICAKIQRKSTTELISEDTSVAKNNLRQTGSKSILRISIEATANTYSHDGKWPKYLKFDVRRRVI